MSSPSALRRFAASRVLRVIALLGWLLMTVSLPATSAMAGEVQHAHAAAAYSMAMMMGHGMAMDGQHADHCCGGDAQSACHCEAMCGSALLPSIPALLGSVPLADVQVSMRVVDAPTPNLIPPLRPPAV